MKMCPLNYISPNEPNESIFRDKASGAPVDVITA